MNMNIHGYIHVWILHVVKIDMRCNESKTVCMVFQPKRRSQIVALSFPQLKLGNFYITYVNSFRF